MLSGSYGIVFFCMYLGPFLFIASRFCWLFAFIVLVINVSFLCIFTIFYFADYLQFVCRLISTIFCRSTSTLFATFSLWLDLLALSFIESQTTLFAILFGSLRSHVVVEYPVTLCFCRYAFCVQAFA